MQVGAADSSCDELNAECSTSTADPRFSRKKVRAIVSSLFYLIAIVLVMASPLVVPVTVTIAHAVSDWRQRARALRPAFKSAFSPAIAGAVPAAA